MPLTLVRNVLGSILAPCFTSFDKVFPHIFLFLSNQVDIKWVPDNVWVNDHRRARGINADVATLTGFGLRLGLEFGLG